MAPGAGPRLRYLPGLFHDAFDPISGPDSKHMGKALVELERVVVETFPAGPKRRGGDSGARMPWFSGLRTSSHGRKVQTTLKRPHVGKQNTRDHRMTPDSLAKVAVSWPAIGARSFAAARHDLVGLALSAAPARRLLK